MYAQRNCPFVYKVTAIEKVVDGDTVDVVIDLGFDVRVSQRVRLLGIDTPESRTRDLEEAIQPTQQKETETMVPQSRRI